MEISFHLRRFRFSFLFLCPGIFYHRSQKTEEKTHEVLIRSVLICCDSFDGIRAKETKEMKKWMYATLAGMMAFTAPTWGASAIAAGEYTGQGAGFGGPVSVTLTVGEDGIEDVSLEGTDETPTVGGVALETLREQILESQGADIDGVAGATFTSAGVKEAVQKALQAASGEEVEAASLTDGTYTATREGYQKEHVTVSVTIEGGKIAQVNVDEITDNPSTITDAPVQQIPAAIVENQTYNVDNVTGATFTSSSIKNAVKDCLEMAGGSDAFSAPLEKAEKVAAEDVQTDILVVGGGAAGMTAAMEAYYAEELGTPSGYSVILIEKAGFLGGSTSVSGGGFFQYPDETGAYDDAWLEASVASDSAIIERDMQVPFDEELQRAEFKAMKRTNDLLDYMGIENALNEDMHVSFFTAPEGGEEKKWAGSYYAKRMNSLFAKEGVDVMLNTRATELLQDEEGTVIGVKVEDKESTYNILAKKVILACGGFANNRDLIAEYAPAFKDQLVFCEGTNTGDGFAMARELGAAKVGTTMFAELGVDNVIGIRPDYCWSFIFSEGKSLFVDVNGERFVDEGITGYEKSRAIAEKGDDTAYFILDADNPAEGAGTDADIAQGYAFKADTLEELAEMIGIPAQKLLETVEKYNGYVDGKEEDPIGGSVESKDRVDTAPYVALVTHPCMITSLVALDVDESCHVLNEQGEVIDNLFATGDLVLGNILSTYNAGHGVGNAVYSGNIAAAQAKVELAQ